MIICSFLSVIAMAFHNSSFSLITAEIASPEVRGMLISLRVIFSVCGSLCQSLVASIFPSYKILANSSAL